jgi:hypothetical protein
VDKLFVCKNYIALIVSNVSIPAALNNGKRRFRDQAGISVVDCLRLPSRLCPLVGPLVTSITFIYLKGEDVVGPAGLEPATNRL